MVIPSSILLRVEEIDVAVRDEAEALARRQHGVVARFQLRTAGTRSAIRNVLESLAWDEVRRGVYAHRAAPVTAQQQLFGALLRCGPGAVVSHRSALALWGVAGFALLPPHITHMRAAHGSRRADDLADVVPHEMRRLSRHHVGTIDGFPATTPSRTLTDIAAYTGPGRLERLVDGMLGDGLVSTRSLARVVDDLSQKGRRGITALRAIVDERGLSYVAPASRLEARLQQLLRPHGLQLRRQVDVGGATWVGRVDFVVGDRIREVLVEVQSERFHDLPSFERDDERRFAALRHAGFTVVPVGEVAIWHHPDEAVDAVLTALRTAPRPS